MKTTKKYLFLIWVILEWCLIQRAGAQYPMRSQMVFTDSSKAAVYVIDYLPHGSNVILKYNIWNQPKDTVLSGIWCYGDGTMKFFSLGRVREQLSSTGKTEYITTTIDSGYKIIFKDATNGSSMGIYNSNSLGYLSFVYDIGGGSETDVMTIRSTGIYGAAFFPFTSSTFDIGSASLVWKRGYFDSLKLGDGTAIPMATLAGVLNAILPTQTGKAGQRLMSSGTSASWAPETTGTGGGIREKTFHWKDVSAVDSQIVWFVQETLTVDSIQAIRTGGTSSTINAKRDRGGSVVDLLSSDYSVTTSRATASGLQNTGLLKNDIVWFTIRTVSGTQTITPQINYH